MEPLSSYSQRIAEWARRCAERADDPEYQANAAKLKAGTPAEQAQRENERKYRLLSACVPYSMWTALADPQPTPAMDAVRAFIASPAECVFLVLVGPVGRGKTFAASWAVSEREGRYSIAHDLVTAGTFDPVWRELQAAPVLALDEVGMEHRNSAFDASLYSLLNTRHAHQRKTVICTNLDAAGFVGRYCPSPTDPLRDRLRTSAQWVTLPGDSLRKHWAEGPEEEGTP